MTFTRAERCRYTLDEDGTAFCENIPGRCTSLTGDFCDKCGGRSVDARTAPTQPTVEELAAQLATDHGPAPDDIRPAPEWTALDPMLAWAAGKAGVELEREATIEIHLAEQKAVYEKVVAEAVAGHGGSQDRLVQALLDRDRLIAQMSREVANGKMGGRLLREFVRAALASADRVQDPQQLQDFLERALGAEKADRRMLKMKGTTL